MVAYYTLKTPNEGLIDVAIFQPKMPRGILQIIHGALEYKERYFPFAQFLESQGIAVVLSDNRGHGNSINEYHEKGWMENYQDLISDQVSVCHFAKKLMPQLPYYLLGHSFGSILARLFLQQHDDEIEKLVLTGTVNYLPAAKLGLKLSNIFLKLYGEKGHSKLVAKLTGDLEAKDNSWLSNNPENNRKAKLDEKMLKSYPIKTSLTIWESNHQLKQYQNYQVKNPQLEILSLVGAQDQKITGGIKGLNDTVATLNKIGYAQVESIILADMKHEVLNEKNNQLVYDKILAFLTKDET